MPIKFSKAEVITSHYSNNESCTSLASLNMVFNTYGGEIVKIRLLLLLCLSLVMLTQISAFPSAVITAEQAAALEGGCLDTCKNFDCGYISHCYREFCDWLDKEACLNRQECNQVLNVPMCVGPDPDGTIVCPPNTNGGCGLCETCQCRQVLGPIYECYYEGFFVRYQVLFKHCP